MSIGVSTDRAVCAKCGTMYSRYKGYFPVSYAVSHKGIGHVPICKKCIENLYGEYLAQCHSVPLSVRQVCRKLDLYWSESVFELAQRKSTTQTVMTQYMAKLNSVTYADKSYDDTLYEEGSMWTFGKPADLRAGGLPSTLYDNANDAERRDVDQKIVQYWGVGYTPDIYNALEQKRSYYTSKLTENGESQVGSELLIKQICILEVNIDRDNAAGRPVDKMIGMLNTLIGSLNLKPVQNKLETDELTRVPLGVLARIYELQRPIPDPDPELQDVDKIKKYIEIYFLGHLCKMLRIRNSYSQAYEDEMERLRVKKPEFNDEDDETTVGDIFDASGDDGEDDDVGYSEDDQGIDLMGMDIEDEGEDDE